MRRNGEGEGCAFVQLGLEGYGAAVFFYEVFAEHEAEAGTLFAGGAFGCKRGAVENPGLILRGYAHAGVSDADVNVVCIEVRRKRDGTAGV